MSKQATLSRLGVDTGGTFTDFFWLDAQGNLQVFKQLSTPHDPSQAILIGLEELAIPGQTHIVHGSTVATNALLERRGARTALIATRGFGDILAIGRQNRPDLYALVPRKPEPLVPKQWRFEVRERINARGEVILPLDLDDVDTIITRINSEGIQSVAISLLFSFLQPRHEEAIADAIRQSLPATSQLHISLSSAILPEYREFERTSTTVINAYVAPLMAHYLERLLAKVAPRPLTIMQSNGGIIQAETAGEQAARTVLSGPAGGVVGAQHVASQAGYDEIITFDMGGTSTDVALCPGRLPTTSRGEIAGWPLRLPIIDIHTVGAGGGSLAYVDSGGALHVGPESAGADPGPACYGRGKQATTTDANLVLDRLDASHFLGGHMQLDVPAARQALEQLAESMESASIEAAAWGVLQVANATMERAIRRISVERGHDPRHFTLVAFGGAGPLHACDLAQNLNIPRVLIPRYPGVLSAVGMLAAVPAKDYSQTVMLSLTSDSLEVLTNTIAALQRRGVREMATEGFTSEELEWRSTLDMRYLGQSHELTVPLPDETNRQQLADAFHKAHQRQYGYHQPEADIEIVTARLAVQAHVAPIEWQQAPIHGKHSCIIGHKSIWFSASGATSTPLYQRESMPPGTEFEGPALIIQYDTTTVVPPAWRGECNTRGDLLLTHLSTA